MHPPARAEFLAGLRGVMGPRDRLVLGTDLVKDPAVLVAAYDDSAGVTADFNRNVLRVLNAKLNAEFDVDAWEHVARFDAEASRIEMVLLAVRDQAVSIRGAALDLRFTAGEEIRTEISTKFTREGVERELADAGVALEEFLTDDEGLVGLALASVAPSS